MTKPALGVLTGAVLAIGYASGTFTMPGSGTTTENQKRDCDMRIAPQRAPGSRHVVSADNMW